MMNDKLKMLIYKSIESNDNVSNIALTGYSYGEIAECFSNMINEELIEITSEMNYAVSQKGYQDKEETIKKIMKKEGLFLKSFDKYRIEKISKYDIFIE